MLCSHIPALSQDQQRKKWYFGNTAEGIIFNRSSNEAMVVNDQLTPFGTGGSAVATDPVNANLLFYTDGSVVNDACHNQMPNGTGLNANNTSNQPVAISAIPGQATKYYVFTNTAAYTNGGNISVSVVDISLRGNAIGNTPFLGDVESSNTAIGLTGRSEGMITVPHANGTDFWLITHEVNSTNYSATLINMATYSAGVVGTFTAISSAGVGNSMAVAHLAYSPLLKKIAVSAQSPSDNSLILDFDDSTGNITFDAFINNTASPASTTINQSVYDLAWSPNGQYLYLSKYGDVNATGADLLQYNYQNASIALTSVLPAPVYRSYGLQIAPDTAIYHLYQDTIGGPFLLGKLTQVDSVASKVVYETSPYNVANFSATQLPAFLPKSTINLTISFSSSGNCQNTPTSFFAMVTPPADSLVWDFGDGSTGKGFSPIHTYTQAQTYTVSLKAFHGSQQQNITQSVTINSFPLSIQLVQDTTACRSEFPPPRGSLTPQQFMVEAEIQGGTPTSTLWSNGDIGSTLTPDSAGYYYVVVTDVSGCAAYAGVNVKEYTLEDQRANIWYFGNTAGIDFNPLPDPPIALDNSAMNAPEGTSTISDRNGEVIFYTNGDKVYNKAHTEIASGIGGDPTAAQSALIVPIPNDETLYYIFTTKAMENTTNHELSYSLFDLKKNNGLGAVVKQNVVLYSASTERITYNNSWLISHEYGNNTFRAYPITENGIGDPVLSSIGSPHSFKSWQTGEGYMKLHSNDTIAVALSNPGSSNTIEVFHFDNATGIISNYNQIDLNEPNGQVYGIAFSAGGNKIFATLKGSPSAVYEYTFGPMGTPILVRRTPAPALELGALETGPDGQIYIAINGSSVLGTIQSVEDINQNSGVNFSGFTLAAGTTSGLGLPSFAQIVANSFTSPQIVVDNSCLGQAVSFTGIATDVIDEFQWTLGDGTSDTSSNPTHTYDTIGTYSVSMQLTNRCGLDTTLYDSVVVSPAAVPPTLPGAIALCTNSIVLDANSNNLLGYTYLWSTGETSKTLTIDEPIIISVINTNADGCRDTAETFVADNRPMLDLGASDTVCTSKAPTELDALNTGATYEWTINGTSSGTTQVQAVDLSTSGIYTYEVRITDPITTCFRVASKEFTIIPSPVFTLSGTSPTTCNVADGTITLQLNASNPAGGPYSYSLTGPGTNQQNVGQVAPTTIGPLTGLEAGTFMSTIIDQSSGCRTSSSFGLSDPGAFTADFSYTDCDPTEIKVSITGGTAVQPVFYTYTNGTTGQVVGPTLEGTARLSPGAGNYTVTAHDDNGNGCLITIDKEVVVTPKTVTITEDICNAPAKLTASFPGATAYTWTGPGIVSGGNTNTINIDARGNYEVTAMTPSCNISISKEVEYTTPLTAEFSQSDACTSSVTLTGMPDSPYIYQWYKEGIFQPNLSGQKIVLGLSEDGTNYSAAIVNTINGCVYRSPSKQVNVVGPVDASIDSIQVCDDNKPFPLTATTTTAGVNYSWFINGNLIPNANGAVTNQIRGGLYRVDVSKSVCTASAEINIVKLPLPLDGNLPNKVSICDHPENKGLQVAETILDPGEYDGYEWFKDDVALDIADQTVTATEAGVYKVVVKNEQNCTNSDQTEIISECIPVIKAPSAFRPNSNQEINKNFSLFTFFITTEFNIFIYNRWGEMVYQSGNRFFKWNGSYYKTNKPVPAGSYAYLIEYKNYFKPELGVQQKRGGVVLVR